MYTPCSVGVCKNSTPSQKPREIMSFGSSEIGKRRVWGDLKKNKLSEKIPFPTFDSSLL